MNEDGEIVALEVEDAEEEEEPEAECKIIGGQGKGRVRHGCLNSFLTGQERDWNGEGWWTRLEEKRHAMELGQNECAGSIGAVSASVYGQVNTTSGKRSSA
ncbi:hypothetical protein ACSQ67_026155 [Phaseolus vulgaris]